MFSFLVKQPYPANINCNGDKKKPFCEDGVPKNFCEKKEAAKVYEHPTQCDRFIYCDHGVRTDVRCPDLTGFNPHISTCDWMGFFRCVDIKKGNMYICIYNHKHMIYNIYIYIYIYVHIYILYIIIYVLYLYMCAYVYINSTLAANKVKIDTHIQYSYNHTKHLSSHTLYA